MSDDNEAPQIVVSASPVPDQVEQAVRTIVLVASAYGAISGFVSAHDLAGAINYIKSNDFLQVALTAVAVGTWLRGQWKTRHRAKQLANVASSPHVPNSVATVK